MSYEITNTRVKSINNLRIHVNDVLKVAIDNDLPEVDISSIKAGDPVVFPIGPEQIITGTIENNELVVSDIDFTGESSDGYLDEDWIPMLKKSTGEVMLKLTWEGGDATNKLTVVNGKVKLS